MAGETRRQRRDARRAAGQDTPAPQRSRSRIGGTPVPADGPVESQVEPHGRGRRGSFIRESYAELRKVEWPSRAQVVASPGYTAACPPSVQATSFGT